MINDFKNKRHAYEVQAKVVFAFPEKCFRKGIYFPEKGENAQGTFIFSTFPLMTGTCRWGEFGEGGLLWGECSARQFEWFEGNPVNDLLLKVCLLLILFLSVFLFTRIV